MMIDQSHQTAVAIQPQKSPSIPDRQPRKRISAPKEHSKSPASPRQKLVSGVKPPKQDMSNPPKSKRVHHEPSKDSSMDPYDALGSARTKTGRVSKALKGRKVHTCPQCGKVYSRAEHLRRHQNNHQGDPLACKICNKVFFREDLLTRHTSKHAGHGAALSRTSTDGEGENSPRSYSESRMSATPTQARESPPRLPTLDTSKSMSSYSQTPYPISPARYTDISLLPVSPTSLSYYSSSSSSTSASTSTSLTTTTSYPSFVTPSDRTPLKSPLQSWNQELPAQQLPHQHHYPVHSNGSWFPYPFAPSTNVIEPAEQLYQAYPTVEWPVIVPNPSPAATSPIAWDPTWMDFERASVKTSSTSSPAPVSAVPPVLLPLSVVNPEDSIQDTQLGIKLSHDRKRAYFDAYWRHFHPQFPILHRTTLMSYMKKTGGGALLAAIMAIGAQYSHEQLAGSDSRILHERCEETIAQQPVHAYSSLEMMQVIVLVEYLSHFKAKRAPDTLSEAFTHVYDQLWQKHYHHEDKAAIDKLSNVPLQASDETVQGCWNNWIACHARERLLSACLILDSRHALLLGRPSHVTNAVAGLELFVPVISPLWDAPTPTRWAQSIRTKQSPTTSISQLLNNMNDKSDPSCDLFQSALVLACYSISITAQLQNSSGFIIPAHSAFDHNHRNLLSKTLSKHPSIQILHRTIELISLLPFRALIATAGESWFFSRKLANDSSRAAEEFKHLKSQLRHWAANSINPTRFNSAGTTPFISCVSIALDIMAVAVAATDPHLSLSFGPEVAIYIAALVLWAAAFNGLSQARATGQASFNIDVDPAEWEPLRAQNLIKEFLPHAQNDVRNAISNITAQTSQRQNSLPLTASNVDQSVLGVTNIPTSVDPVFPLVESHAPYLTPAFPPPGVLDSWLTGSSSAIRWTAHVLGGSGQRQNGAGELIEGAIGVLEKLGRSAWTRSWF